MRNEMRTRVMKMAWFIAGVAVKNHGGKKSEYIRESLKIAWEYMHGIYHAKNEIDEAINRVGYNEVIGDPYVKIIFGSYRVSASVTAKINGKIEVVYKVHMKKDFEISVDIDKTDEYAKFIINAAMAAIHIVPFWCKEIAEVKKLKIQEKYDEEAYGNEAYNVNVNYKLWISQDGRKIRTYIKIYVNRFRRKKNSDYGYAVYDYGYYDHTTAQYISGKYDLEV